MEEENTFLNADNIYEEVEGEAGKKLTLKKTKVEILLVLLKVDMLKQKKLEKLMKEDGYKHMKTLEVYILKRIRFRESEKSRIFVKITKTKVLAAYGQLVDVIFGTGEFPILV